MLVARRLRLAFQFKRAERRRRANERRERARSGSLERVTGAEGMHGRVERRRRVSIPEYTLGGTDRKRPAHKSNLDPVAPRRGDRKRDGEEESAATPDSSARNKSKDGPETKRATAPRVRFVSSSHLFIPLRLSALSQTSPCPIFPPRKGSSFVSSLSSFARPCSRCILRPVSTPFFVSNSSRRKRASVCRCTRLSLASLNLSRLLSRRQSSDSAQVRPGPRRI